MWVLLVYLAGNEHGFAHDFTSERACQVAGEEYTAAARNIRVKWVCVPK